jgi:hypothetical protein
VADARIVRYAVSNKRHGRMISARAPRALGTGRIPARSPRAVDVAREARHRRGGTRLRGGRRAAVMLSFCLIPIACNGPSPVAPTEAPLVPFSSPISASGPPHIFVGAGDVALCGSPDAAATARLLDVIGGTVFALGDHAYPDGRAEDYRDCYDPTWGRHRGRTRPVAGNHDYQSAGAVPYFDYFGPNAGPSGLGYYSFELGSWHVIALNSNVAADGRSTQAAWLRADLATHPAGCTLAYWHHPLFSSGAYGDAGHMRDVWRILHAAGADVVLAAHEHFYERFAPQDASGAADPARGIRQFIVGTGGAPLRDRVTVRANSEAYVRAHGVLKLTLRGGGYDWDFVSVTGPGDIGTAECH